jgi:mannosyltransferase
MIIIDGIIFSIQKFGGISTYFKHLTNELFKSEYKTDIFLYNKDIDGFSNFTDIIAPRFLERYRRLDIKNNNDKIILHSSYYRYCNNKNVKNVLTVYDFIYEKYESNFIKRNVHQLQKKQAIKNSHAIICISESTKRDFLEYYPEFNPEQVFVTHLAHSSESVENMANFRIENKFEKPYVMFVGMRSIHKNFNACVKAIVNINVDFKIVGGGPLNELEYKLLEANLAGRYMHLLNVDNNTLNKLYSNAVCLLYPSLYEGFGLPILEAQANGCAVITSNVSSLPEVAGKSAILLNSTDAQSIENSVIVLMNSKLNKFHVDQGFVNIKRFSWAKTARETIDIYSKIDML